MAQKNGQGVKAILAEEGTLVVSRTRFGQTEEDLGQIEIRPFATQPAQVTVALGKTINLGNYESARIEVRLTIPCYVEELVATYRDVLEATQEMVAAEAEKIIGRGRIPGVKSSSSLEDSLL